MRWLNYHHLHYFWVVADKGSVTAASKALRVAQPTISTQLRALEEMLGGQLFDRKGRTLELTELGRLVHEYAREIFSLGSELIDVVEGKSVGRVKPLRVGIVDSVPKRIAARLLEPAFAVLRDTPIVCDEDHTERLLGELALQELDVVIADSPIPTGVRIRAYHHPLGKSPVSFVGTPSLEKQFRKGFPHSLHGAPMLIPSERAAVRRGLDQWFDRHDIQPRILGEFQDGALMKMVGRSGRGIFPVATVLEKEICKEYGVKVIGRTKEALERFYLISVERKIKHPGVRAIIEGSSGSMLLE